MIKAIETEYGGVLFRSKLEAMHAKFFDLVGIPWIYEPHFLGDNYLPDFLLPDAKTYFEVKGRGIPGREKAINVVRELNIFLGLKNTFRLVVSDGTHCDFYFYEDYINSYEDGKDYFLYDKTLEPHLGKCVSCGTVHFYDICPVWVCPNCGETSKKAVYGDVTLWDLFEYATGKIKLPSIRQDWKHRSRK